MADATRSGGAAAEPVTFEMEIDEGQTSIRVSGEQASAVVVRSASGEKIYLPPEDFDQEPGDAETPYESASDSPYESRAGADDSPYQARPDASSVTGLEPTADGYLIIHPEPVEDVRFLR